MVENPKFVAGFDAKLDENMIILDFINRWSLYFILATEFVYLRVETSRKIVIALWKAYFGGEPEIRTCNYC